MGGWSLGGERGYFNIVYFGSKYYLTNSQSLLSSSTDGITWSTPSGSSLLGVASSGTRMASTSGNYSSTGNLVTLSDNALAFTYLGTATLGA
jgi:hypothetical protein